jgi:hypothetical protein
MLCDVRLNVLMLSVATPYIVILIVALLIVVMQSVILLSAVALCYVMLG